jgi:DNA-binding transcriptional LysR family regulator
VPETERNPSPLKSPLTVNLRLLEVFLCVIEEGTMTGAAERLGLSQAAVSQAITSLEQLLAVRLFDRSVRPPALTLVGQAAGRRAAELLENAHRFEDEIRYSGMSRVPLLRIGMLDSFASTVGPHVLNALRDAAAEWTVASGYKATRYQALLDRISDIVVTSDETAIPAEVDAQSILTEPFVLVVPASFAGTLSDLRKLESRLDFIRYGRDAHMGPAIAQYLDSAGVTPVRRFQFDTTDAAMRMVAGGFGWTIMTPLICIKSMIEPSAVRVLPLPGRAMRRRLLVAVRRGEGATIAQRLRNAAIAALQDFTLPKISLLLPQVAGEFQISRTEASPVDDAHP